MADTATATATAIEATGGVLSTAASTATAIVSPWVEFASAISNLIGSAINGFVQGAKIGATQRLGINQQNNAWSLGVINSGSKNYAFLAVGAIIIIIIILLISKRKSN
jgi:LPXTG-motif cell wall-anchored protein